MRVALFAAGEGQTPRIGEHIARKASAPTDTSRDYEFTDWPARDRFVEGMVRETAARRQETPRGDLVTSRS